MKTTVHFWSHLAQFFLEWEMFQTKVVEKVKTYFVLKKIFCAWKSCRFGDNVEKYWERSSPQMTILRMRIACRIPKATHTHTHTHTQICNTYCFLKATTVTRTRLNVTLYVKCLSCHPVSLFVNYFTTRGRSSSAEYSLDMFTLSKCYTLLSPRLHNREEQQQNEVTNLRQ